MWLARINLEKINCAVYGFLSVSLQNTDGVWQLVGSFRFSLHQHDGNCTDIYSLIQRIEPEFSPWQYFLYEFSLWIYVTQFMLVVALLCHSINVLQWCVLDSLKMCNFLKLYLILELSDCLLSRLVGATFFHYKMD
jgi:hypothetical protein